jgi:iron complex outermembrane receptor protein
LVTQPTSVGLPLFASYPYINAGATQTEGIDVDLQTKWDLGIAGKLTGELNYTRTIEYNITVNGVSYDLAGTHGPSEISGDTGNPKDRAVANLTWDKGPFSATWTVNYTGPFVITDPSEASAGLGTCAGALQGQESLAYGYRFVSTSPTPGYLCSVHHFTESNIYVRVAANDHLDVHGSIVNLFNAQAPIDAQTYGGGGLLAYDGAFHQDGAIGRFFMVGATYKF